MPATDSPNRKWFVLAAMCLGIFTVAFNTTAIMNATTAIQNELHLSTTTLSWIINAYMLTTASCIILGGQFGDIFGRRRMIYLGASTFIIASFLIASATNFEALLLGRVLQGLGAAFITPGTLAVVKTAFPEHLKSRAISIWTAAIGVGFSVGPTLSGILTETLGWRYIFWINVPVLLLAVVIIAIKGRRSVISQDIKIDLLGVILLIAGILPFTLGLIEGNNWGWDSYATYGLLAVGIFALIIFWRVELHHKNPLIHFENFHLPVFVAGNIGMGTTVFSMMPILYFFNIYMQNPVLLNLSPLQAGLYLLPFSVSLFISSYFCSTKLTNRFGFCGPIVISLLCMSLSFFSLMMMNIHSQYGYFVPHLMIFGFCIGICFSSAPALGMSALPDKSAGEASGVINTVNYIGGVLAISMGTILFHHFGIEAAHKIINTVYFDIAQIQHIDKILLGDNSALSTLLHTAPDMKKNLMITALQEGGLASFISVMIMCGLVTFISACVCFYLIPKGHGKEY